MNELHQQLRHLIQQSIQFAHQLPKNYCELVYDREDFSFFQQISSQPINEKAVEPNPPHPKVSPPATVRPEAPQAPSPVAKPPHKEDKAIKKTVTESRVETVKESETASLSDEPQLLKLQPMGLAEPKELKPVRMVVKELMPQLVIVETPLQDTLAKQRPKPKDLTLPTSEVIILSASFEKAEEQLLENLCRAIQQLGLTCELVSASEFEQQDSWEKIWERPIKLAILALSSLHEFPSLSRYCKRDPETNAAYLHTYPVILMGEPKRYLNTPRLKSALWENIQQATKPILHLKEQ